MKWCVEYPEFCLVIKFKHKIPNVCMHAENIFLGIVVPENKIFYAALVILERSATCFSNPLSDITDK
jgi:hypothetical protein